MSIDVLQSLEIIEAMENYIAQIRPPEGIRHQVDITYKIENQSVIIYELRPMFSKKDEVQECFIAKATFVKTQKCWKVFWQRADLKWHPYPLKPTVKTIHQFIRLVREDKHFCFWG